MLLQINEQTQKKKCSDFPYIKTKLLINWFFVTSVINELYFENNLLENFDESILWKQVKFFQFYNLKSIKGF